MDNNLIKYVVDKFDLGTILKPTEKINKGLTNEIYKINTKSGKFIIKVLNNDNINKIDLIEFSEKINALAYNENIKSYPAIKKENKYIQKYNNKYFLLYKYYEGKVISSKEITLNKCKILAKELAKIHKLDTTLINDIVKDKEDIYTKKIDFNYYFDKSKNIDEEWVVDFKDNYKNIVNIYEKVYNCYQNLSEEKTFTHKDLNRKNILWKSDDEFAIIDWENARFSNPSLDFFNTAWFLTEDVKKDKYTIFAKEYFKNFKFKDSIDTAVYAALIDEILWLEFNLKRALRLNNNNEKNNIETGKSEIKPTIREILNYYKKIDIMKNICNDTIM